MGQDRYQKHFVCSPFVVIVLTNHRQALVAIPEPLGYRLIKIKLPISLFLIFMYLHSYAYVCFLRLAEMTFGPSQIANLSVKYLALISVIWISSGYTRNSEILAVTSRAKSSTESR